MRYINTSEDSITFIDVDGKQLIVPKNRVYTHFNVDTVTFLLIERYDNEGICLFSTKASDLQINGETYTYQELLDGEGISDLFSPTGLSFEVVEELPQSGEEGTIYLVPNDHDTYTEYIWIAEEEKWEAIGDSDIDLSNYYTKTQTDNTFATQTVVNEEIAARISGDGALNTALGTKADKSDTYTKTQVDTALSAKANSADLATVATSGDYDDLTNKPTIPAAQVNSDWNASSGVAQILNKPTNVSAFTNDAGYLTQHQSLSNYYTKSETDAELADKQDVLTAGTGITIDANNVISATGGGGGDYVDVPTFNQKEVAIAQALTDLNENKADKTELPDTSTFATKTELNAKQDVLTAGTGISIQNNVISATGGGASYQFYSETDEEQEEGTTINRHKSGIIEITDEGGTIDSGMVTYYDEIEEDGSISYTNVSSSMYADKDDGETVNGSTIAVGYNYASMTVSEDGEDNGTTYSKYTDFIVNPDSLTVEIGEDGNTAAQLELNNVSVNMYSQKKANTQEENYIKYADVFLNPDDGVEITYQNIDKIERTDINNHILVNGDGIEIAATADEGNEETTLSVTTEGVTINGDNVLTDNDAYTKTEIDAMIGNIQTILASI